MSDSSSRKPINTARRRTLRHCVAALALPVLLSACATTGGFGDPAAAVRERAQAYWAARVVGDSIKAYGLDEVSTRPDASIQRYVQLSGNIQYLSAEVQEVVLKTEDRASVRTKLAYRAPVPGLKQALEGDVWTDWVRIKGAWYHAGRSKDEKSAK